MEDLVNTLIEERRDLSKKQDKLIQFMVSKLFYELQEPDRALLVQQARHMQGYHEALTQRIESIMTIEA